MTTVEGWYAYASTRGSARIHPRRHAVHEMARLCGALDIECYSRGARAVTYLGAWYTDHPDNCVLCAVAVATAVTDAAEDVDDDHECEPA